MGTGESRRSGSPYAHRPEAGNHGYPLRLRVNVAQRNCEDCHKDPRLNLLLEDQLYTDEGERKRLGINGPVRVRANVSGVRRGGWRQRRGEVDVPPLRLDELGLSDHCHLLGSLARRDVATRVPAQEDGFDTFRGKESTRHEIAESGSSSAHREPGGVLGDRQVADDVCARLLCARRRSKRQGRNQGDNENEDALHLLAPPFRWLLVLLSFLRARIEEKGEFAETSRG